MQKYEERQVEASMWSPGEDSRVSSVSELLELKSVTEQKKMGLLVDPAKMKSMNMAWLGRISLCPHFGNTL